MLVLILFNALLSRIYFSVHSLKLGCSTMENLETSRRLFQKLCPKNFFVFKAEPIRTCGESPCRWLVNYVFVESGSIYPIGVPKTADIKELIKRVPRNSKVINFGRCVASAGFNIEYSVKCNCRPEFSFEPAKY